jgi:4-hydroxy-4-methyl-2-oxoglutarate aldolase
VAARVGQIAYMELYDDIQARRQNYKNLGKEFDHTTPLLKPPAEFFKRHGLPEDPNKP